MTLKHYLYILAPLALTQPLVAQEESYLRELRQWDYSLIPATLRLGGSPQLKRGITSLGTSYRSGSYHHIQEGERRQSYSFNTEQWLPIGKYLYGYGKLGINLERIGGRAWADQYRPIRSNPYTSGSPIAGDYRQQDFALTARLSTIELGRWTGGIGLDYTMGDLSRLRDPRSRSVLLDYKLTPSLSYRISSSHTLALGLSYQRRKEKLLGLTTVQEDPNLSYALMRGLGEVSLSVGGYRGFSRQWVDHRFGFTLAQGYQSKSFGSMLQIGYERGNERVSEERMYQPGHYLSDSYKLSWSGIYRVGRHSHRLELGWDKHTGRANEYLSQLITTTDPTTRINSQRWDILLTYKDRYRQSEQDVHLNYRYVLSDHDKGSRLAYIGLENSVNTYEQTYTLPYSSMQSNRLTQKLVGGYNLRTGRKHSLQMDAKLGYSHPMSGSTSGIDEQSTNSYITEVLLPLHRYDTSRRLHLDLSLELQHQLKLGGKDMLGFLRLDGSYTTAKPIEEGYRSERHQRYQLGLSLGLYH